MRIVGLLAVATIFGATGCGANRKITDYVLEQQSVSMAHIVMARIGLNIPPGAKIEYSSYRPGQDDADFVVITLAKADAQELLRKIAAKAGEELSFSKDDKLSLPPNEAHWRPFDAPDLESTQLSWNKGAESLNIGRSKSADGRVRLFLFWYQL